MSTKYWTSTSSGSFNTASNWSDGVAPANSDTLIFNSLGTADVTSNLSTTLTGLTLIVEQSYTGQIGVLSGSTATYLKIDGGTLYVGQSTGQSAGSGSPLLMVDFGANNSNNNATAYVFDSSPTSANTFYPPILLNNSSTNGVPPVTTVRQNGGSVGFAALPSDTAGSRHVSLYISKSVDSQPSVPPTAYLGRGCITDVLNVNSGTVYSRSTSTLASAVISGDARFVYEGSGDITAASVWETSLFEDRGTHTTTTSLDVQGTYRRRNPKIITISNLFVYGGATFDVDAGTSCVTITNKQLVSCSMQDVKFLAEPQRWL